MIAILCADMENLANWLAETEAALHIEKEDCCWGDTCRPLYIARALDALFCEIPPTKAALSVCVTQLIARCKPHALLLCGSAGAIVGGEEAIGSMAIASDVLQYDADFSDLGYPPATLPYCGKSIFTSDRALCAALQKAAKQRSLPAKTGRFISADRFLACEMLRRELRVDYLADFLDTESGTIGEIAALFGLPFGVVKGISNLCDRNGDSDYQKNRSLAALQAAAVCLAACGDICKLL